MSKKHRPIPAPAFTPEATADAPTPQETADAPASATPAPKTPAAAPAPPIHVSDPDLTVVVGAIEELMQQLPPLTREGLKRIMFPHIRNLHHRLQTLPKP